MFLKAKIHLLLLLILVLSSPSVFAQKKFFISNFTTKTGLPDNDLKSLQFDKDGFLWATYTNGLLRFDGYNFRNFVTSKVPYTAFLLSRTLDGEILALDASGTVFEIKNQKIDTLRKGAVNSINYYTSKGFLPSKNFYFKSTTPHFNAKRDTNWFFPPLYLFPQSREDCIIRTKTGLGLYHFTTHKKDLNLEQFNPRNFICINREIYFFSEQNQLYWVNQKQWRAEMCMIKGDILKDPYFKALPELLSSTVWDYNSSASCVLIENNLYEFSAIKNNPKIIESSFITNELPQNCIINALIYKPQDNLLLVSTDTRGLFIYREQKFKFLTYPNPERGTNNAYYCQLELDSNRIFTDWNREFSIKGGTKSSLKIKRNYSDNIFRDRSGFLYYLSGEEHLKKLNPKTNISTPIYDPRKSFVLCYYQEGDSIWVGTTNSIGYIKNDTLHTVKLLDNNSSNSNLFQIMRWKENKIWFCNYTGVFKYDPVRNTVDTLQDLYQKYPYNFTLFKDYLIIGTFGRGYYFYKDGKAVQMPLDRNHYLLQAYFFVNDTLGYTWIGTSNGIYKTRFNDLDHYFKDTSFKVSYMHYGEEDGILSPEFNGGCVPPVVNLKNGYTSMPNVEGLVWFKPSEIKNPDFFKPFFIDGVFADDSLFSVDKHLVLGKDFGTLRIEFSTPYWGTPDNLDIEYCLEGYTKKWVPLKIAQNSLVFSNLPSGEYTFRLRKRSGFDATNYISTALQISIPKKFYETLSFYIICLIGTLLFSFVVARLYARNIQKRNIALEKSVQQRTMELIMANAELKESVSVKDKLISIISHDIVTPLRFITMVARKGSEKHAKIDSEKIQEALIDIKNTSEKLHDNAQNILNWIKHQNKRITLNKSNVALNAFLEEVADMFKEIASNKGTVIINKISDDDLIKSDKSILFIVLHNLISNSTKFTSNGLITITGLALEHTYSIVIEDNGVGMTQEQLQRIQNIQEKKPVTSSNPTIGDGGNGLGYIIISELIEMLSGSIHVASSVGKGTRVEIILPLQI
ncbi:MAG: hypothetical protein IPP32_03705 [Bacteroidetes bacterium]|nr:hypothetical protein [Bacteroidota bacterium]